MNEIEFYANHPVLLHQVPFTNFGFAQLSYNNKKGLFKKTQEPENTTQLAFSSFGIRDVKKLRVSGGFTYEKEWQFGAGLAHRYNINDPSPYYLFAQKPGNWDKVNYILSGDITTDLKKNKVIIGVGADYIARQNYRSTDPRPQINVFSFKPRVFGGYKLTDVSYLGLTYKYGYGKNIVGVMYKNDLYGESLIYPEYINYLNAGFGYILQQQTAGNQKNLKEDIHENDVEINFSYKYAKGILNILGGIKSKNQEYYRNSSTSNFRADISSFKLNIPYLTIRLTQNTALKKWLVSFDIEQQKGKDFNNQLNGNNYIFKSQDISLSGGFTSLSLWEIYLKGNLETLDKADGVSNNRMKINTAKVSLLLAKIFQLPQNHTIRLALQSQLKQNLSSSLVISPIFESYFVQQVIRPDYAFLRSNTVDTGIEISYLFKKSKNLDVFVKGSFNNQQNLSNNELVLGKSRTMLEFKSGFVF